MSTLTRMPKRGIFGKLPLFIIILALCQSASIAAAQCTIEDVFMFPEQFLEQTITFTNTRLLGEVSRDDDLFLIGVRSKKGKHVYAGLASDGFAFIVGESIAAQLVDVLQPDTRYPAHITATLKTYRGSYREYYVAQVSSIQLLDQLGRVTRVFEAKEYTLNDPPTIESVLLFPELYAQRELVFANVEVDGEVRRRDNIFSLQIRSPRGSYISPTLSSRSITFVAPEPIAMELIHTFDVNTRYLANLTVEIKTLRQGYSDFPVAQISKVELLNKFGEITGTITAESRQADETTLPTIDHVYMFPERFIGETLVFSNVRVDGEIERSKDVFSLGVYSETGKRVSPFLGSEGFTFVISANLASQLVDVIGPRTGFNANLTATFTTKQQYTKDHAVAAVSTVEILDSFGQVKHKLVDQKAAQTDAAPPSIERVYLFPEQYMGSTLTFNNAELDGNISRDGQAFLLGIRSERGKIVSSILFSEGFAFLTTENMADQLVDFLKPGSRYPVNLTVTMKPYLGRYTEYRVAEVISIEFLDSLGTTFAAISETDYQPKEPPTIEQVYLFPERFVNKTLVFKQVELDGEIRRRDDIFSLRVRSPGGKSVSSALLGSGFTFVVSEAFAAELASVMEPSDRYTANITAALGILTDSYSEYYAASILSIELLDGFGAVVQVISE